MNNVSKTIKWADWSWNPIVGCTNNCPYCYARRIATRFAGTKAFPNGFKPTFHPERLEEPLKLKKPSKIFVCSMGEIFSFISTENDEKNIRKIIRVTRQCPQHIFQFLTQKPYLYKLYKFPLNCWLGVTVVDNTRGNPVNGSLDIRLLLNGNENNIRFVSFEPLLDDIVLPSDFNCIDWVILGGQTGSKKFYPPEEWIQKIEDQADILGIPVFEKDNLRKEWKRSPRREFPISNKINERTINGDKER